jgi:hypothetical protein
MNGKRIFAGFDQDGFGSRFEESLNRVLHHWNLVAPARQNISSFFDEMCFSSSLRSSK